ncbi:MAG: hypothetical protein LBU32_06590 [Clostridiales bacterium]|nr:hypothetical protein [Clostridiales bacterium]
MQSVYILAPALPWADSIIILFYCGWWIEEFLGLRKPGVYLAEETIRENESAIDNLIGRSCGGTRGRTHARRVQGGDRLIWLLPPHKEAGLLAHAPTA